MEKEEREIEREREEEKMGEYNDIAGPILPPGMHTVHSTVRGPDLTQLRPSSTFPPPMIGEGEKPRLSWPAIGHSKSSDNRESDPPVDHRARVDYRPRKPNKPFGGRINI